MEDVYARANAYEGNGDADRSQSGLPRIDKMCRRVGCQGTRSALSCPVYETIATIRDEVLVRRVTLCLLTRGLCGAEQVAIKAVGGTVILCGELASRESKLECLECCRHVAGVVRVVDQLRLSMATKTVRAISVVGVG